MILIPVLLIIGGTWLVSDSIYSLALYLNSPGYEGKKQTWKKDHWIRLVRLLWGLLFIFLGVQLLTWK